jgi:hypothetical protein
VQLTWHMQPLDSADETNHQEESHWHNLAAVAGVAAFAGVVDEVADGVADEVAGVAGVAAMAFLRLGCGCLSW